MHLGSNQPRMQILDVNSGSYAPDWTTTAGRLTITPVICVLGWLLPRCTLYDLPSERSIIVLEPVVMIAMLEHLSYPFDILQE